MLKPALSPAFLVYAGYLATKLVFRRILRLFPALELPARTAKGAAGYLRASLIGAIPIFAGLPHTVFRPQVCKHPPSKPTAVGKIAFRLCFPFEFGARTLPARRSKSWPTPSTSRRPGRG